MLVNDHINLMNDNPLIGKHEPEFGDRFVNMSSVYDKELIGVNAYTFDSKYSFAISVDDLVEFINEVKQEDVESKYIQKKKKGNTWIQKKSDKNKNSGNKR